MGKISKIDKAIEVLKAERAVLDLAIVKLQAQQATAPAAKPRKAKAAAAAQE